MAPHVTDQLILTEAHSPQEDTNQIIPKKLDRDGFDENNPYKWRLSYRNIIAFLYMHITSVYALGLLLTGYWRFYTLLWSILYLMTSSMGITAGAHRLWAHRTYKATWQLRLILAICQAAAFQNHIYEWCRDHRVHHKFADTDADPHNVNRGFFFSHMGWLLVKKHRDVKTKGKQVDMSDLERDPIVMWQKRLYLILMPLFAFIIPTCVPIYCWNEDPKIAWYAALLRYIIQVNGTWCVNSVAHIWGTKPFDISIKSVENKYVGILAFGEGWHNYHHVFPWDYKAAELGNYGVNMSTGFIDFFAKIGWAYDLKTVPLDVIQKRAARTGDGSLKGSHDYHHHMNVWGYGDKDMTEEDKKSVETIKNK